MSKDNIRYLSMDQVIEQVRQPQSRMARLMQQKLDKLPNYTQMILSGAQSPEFAVAMQEAETRIFNNQQANPESSAANTAGPYFANENVLAGSMVPTGVTISNQFGNANVPGWQERGNKIKLGPGITFIEPPSAYAELLQIGAQNPELSVNYTAPFGTGKSRQGLADIMNARICVEEEIFTCDQVIQTEGATEAIDLTFEAVRQLYPGTEILSAGFSYYTAFFTADQKGFSLKRVMPNIIEPQAQTIFQPSPNEIMSAVTAQTKVLLLTLPNNPTGESYNYEALISIMSLAKEQNMLIIYDAIFDGMYFNNEQSEQSPVLRAAIETGMLENVVVVDSLSKRRGFAGARAGWIATQNSEILKSLENIILARRCNPQLILEPLLQFEGAASLLSRVGNSRNTKQLRLYAQQIIDARKLPLSVDTFLNMYQEWVGWQTNSQIYYQQNLEMVNAVLDQFSIAGSQNEAAFNTFIGFPEIQANSIDAMAKLMLLLGTYTQIGPCFGISEDTWQKELGLWARVSYASSREELAEGLVRMIALAQAYRENNLGNSEEFPVLNINYNRQV